MLIDFIDVSMHQGDIDWLAVPCPAVIKATEGVTYTDPRFVQNRDGARSAGKAMGFYHFLSARRPGDQQASHFLDVVGDPHDAELLVLDWETDPSVNSPIGERPAVEVAQTFVDVVVAHGHHHRLRLYANDWAAAHAHEWGVPFWCASFVHWIDANGEHHIVAAPVEAHMRDRHASAWQWSNCQYVTGIGGRVDANQILDPDRWSIDMALTDEDVNRIAEAVWNRMIDAHDWSAPAGQFFGALRDEITRPDKLEARIAAHCTAGSGGATADEVADELAQRLRD